MLRDYQKQAVNGVFDSWDAGNQNVLLELPTGGGKTYTFSHIVKEMNVPTAVMAHRHELIGQMSLALAEMGIPHRIVASDKAVNEIVKAHKKILGKIMFDPTSPVVCASVDTLIKRDPSAFHHIKLWVMDEAHHVLRENKWGECVKMFPNARGLGVTATPVRADGKGLGAHADGVFHDIVHGPSGQELIDLGFLSPYRCVIVDVDDLNFNDVETGATGDLKQNQLRTATKESSKLVGSVVQQFRKWAPGRTGLTFCVDIEHAERTLAEFQQAGAKAKLITGKTPFLERATALEQLKNKQLDNIINVDLFGEGFDAPGVDVVSMARRTESFSLYSQQIGRALRPVYAEGYDLSTVEGRKAAIANGPKPYALVIDHVGNILNPNFGLPTSRRFWSLDAREKRGKGEKLSQEDKLKACTNENCAMPYPAYYIKCPFCGQAPKVQIRSRDIEEVDGDLMMLDDEMMKALDREANRIMQPGHAPRGLPQHATLSVLKKHRERAKAQEELRESIKLFGGYAVQDGLTIREAQKKFYLKFGVDVLTAQTLGRPEAEQLKTKIDESMGQGV